MTMRALRRLAVASLTAAITLPAAWAAPVGEAVHFDVVPASRSIGFLLLFGPASVIGLVIGSGYGATTSRAGGGQARPDGSSRARR